MVLAGRTFWSSHRTDTTNRWCLAWKDGLQLKILETEETHHLAMATWHKCLLLTALVEIKETVGTEETKEVEIFVEETFVEMIMEMMKEIATPMVVEPTSTRMPEEVGVAKEASLAILLVFRLLPLANSLSLT